MFNWNDFMNDFPYTNFSDINVSWFLNKFKQIFDEWHGLYTQLQNWKTETDEYNANWRAEQEQAFATWKNNFENAIDEWKAQTETDIGTWENETLANLETWKTTFITQYNELKAEVEQIAEDAETAKNSAQTSATSAQQSADSASATALALQTSLQQIDTNTGDISDLKTQLHDSFPTLSFVDGYIKTNGEIDSAYMHFKTTDYIACSETIFVSGTFRNLTSPYKYLNCYDVNKNFISGLIDAGTTVTYDNEKITLPNNTYYIRLTTATAKYETLKVIIPGATKKDISELNTEITSLETDYNINKETVNKINLNSKQLLTFVDGYVETNGSLNPNYSNFKTTNFIPANKTIIISGTFRNLSGSYKYLNCYDKNYNFIGGLINAGSTIKYTLEEITLPENTNYIRITDATVNYESIELYLPSINISQILHLENDISSENEYSTYFDWLGFGSFDDFVSIGDSLSVGYRTKNDGTVLSSDKPHSWPAFVEKRTGSKAYWTGKAGETCATWLTTTDTTWGLNYCQNLGAKNLYIISMGANESDITIGTIADINDNNPTTLYGYVGKVIREIRTISPNSFIICTGVSRKQNSTAINTVYKNVCAEFTKCYYMDCEMDFNSELLTPYYYNYHYTITGYDIIANMFNEKLKKIMVENPSDFLFIDG